MPSIAPEQLRQAVSEWSQRSYSFMRTKNFIHETGVERIDVDGAYVDCGDGLPVVIISLKAPFAARDENDNLHVGALMAIVDQYSTTAQLGNPDYWVPSGKQGMAPVLADYWKPRINNELGVSRNLRLRSVLPVPCGSRLVLECKILENTETSCLLSIRVFSEDGKLLAVASHDKVKLLKPIQAKI